MTQNVLKSNDNKTIGIYLAFTTIRQIHKNVKITHEIVVIIPNVSGNI